MLVAAVVAIVLRVNLPIAVVFVWVSNPITMPPLLIFSYELGAWLLGLTPANLHIELTWAWFSSTFEHIWEPLWLGCIVLGAFSALSGYLCVRLLWRLHLIRTWQRRKLQRLQPHAADED